MLRRYFKRSTALRNLRLLRRCAKFAWQVQQSELSRGAKVAQWRLVARGRGKPAVKPAEAYCLKNGRIHFESWLKARKLHKFLTPGLERNGYFHFLSKKKPAPAHWLRAYHGTWFYSLAAIVRIGRLLESHSIDLGHEFWQPGVYVSPRWDTARWYARGHKLFPFECAYHRVILEVRVNFENVLRNRSRGGGQWVFHSKDVHIHSVWVEANTTIEKGEERCDEWRPELEVNHLAIRC